MSKPWTDGPRELIQHAIGHIALGGDADRRFAFISIDNSVELMAKTYLGLPLRARRSQGPTRKQLDAASESFPALLSLLEEFAASEIVGLSLDDIEWYHRLRNQLYHSGNGITVEAAKVEAYLQLALTLFENLFQERIVIKSLEAAQTRTGQFLAAWNEFQHQLRQLLPSDESGPIYYKRLEILARIDRSLADLYESSAKFRNELVHGISTPPADEIDAHIRNVQRMLQQLRRLPPQSTRTRTTGPRG